MPTRLSGKVDVTIRVDKTYADRLDEVASALEASGLSAVERHERFLLFNGSVSADRVQTLRQVSGVTSVREDATYKKS